MYRVFDDFCKIPTWDTSHPADQERFRRALCEVVSHPDFSPEMMGSYIEEHHAEPIWPKEPATLKLVIARLVEEARTEMLRRRSDAVRSLH